MNSAPKHLKFTETHEWLDSSAEDMRIGITDHAQQLLGDMVYVELPQVGQDIHAGEELGVLESVKAASDFYAPISGVVVAINEEVNNDPALVNSDPYGAGWLIKLRPNNLDDINALLDEEEYHNEIAGDH